MKSAALIALFTLVFYGAPLLGAEAGKAGQGCEGFAAEVVAFAKANDINKITVLGFAGKDGVQKSETDYISERTAACLAGYKKPALIDRAVLAKALKGTRLSSSAGAAGEKAKMIKVLFSLDAVVTGTVFAAGHKLKVLAKLVDINSGRVLLAEQSESEREWAQFPEVPGLELEWDGQEWPLPPLDLKDAVSEPGQGSCADRKMRLTGLNSELVEAKALYWAAKMKEPGFSVRGLRRNPGTEIADPEVKARFYRLLESYFRADYTGPPDPDKIASVLDLIAEEKLVYDECGHR